MSAHLHPAHLIPATEGRTGAETARFSAFRKSPRSKWVILDAATGALYSAFDGRSDEAFTRRTADLLNAVEQPVYRVGDDLRNADGCLRGRIKHITFDARRLTAIYGIGNRHKYSGGSWPISSPAPSVTDFAKSRSNENNDLRKAGSTLGASPATEGRTAAEIRAEYLEAAEARQPREGINSKFCRASHAELARADMMIGWRLDKAAQAAHRAAFQAKWGGK